MILVGAAGPAARRVPKAAAAGFDALVSKADATAMPPPGTL